ncbi:porin [Atlantibacter hermannii]|uniref:porin n=1 Tax=Atlantibacter hermannii TaxID=565 RepID=UPI0028B1D070|nr:porin [Atlantibacter hermannii]
MKKWDLSLMLLVSLTSGSVMAAHSIVNDAGDSLTLDGRFEVRYQDRGGDNYGEWNSGSSRFGLKGKMQLDDGWTGFGHAEWAYNSGSNGDNIYDRLVYAGLEHSSYGKIAAGPKQWSTFYDVAWYTDMGRIFGTRGSGVYNLADWGIASGAGRAENSITYRNAINKEISYGFTYQTARDEVALANNATATLKKGIGASITYKPYDGLTLGAAYHQNELADLTPHVNGVKDGDSMRVMLVGMNYSNGGFYSGMTFHVGENWEAVSEGDNDIMFDTLGGEFYVYYHFDYGFRPTFNYNYMKDRSDETSGYKRILIIPGLEYHFRKDKFLIWAEYQIDQGSDRYNGSKFENRDNQLAAGLRYYF